MSQEHAVGQRVGDYEILAVLGAGGMGKVYKVRNVISDRIEAMKVLLPDLAGQKELAERFLREIKVLASLSHPNIAALRTALSLDDQLVMIMEFVEGVTMSSRLQRGPLLPAEAINYVDQVLAALSYAHHMNIIHRDIKPANMMLTPQGFVKLMDFGIARSGADRSLTMTGTTLGSLNYMPPEQVNGEHADARSDIYSLGVSLYEMVTGQLPFKGDSNYSLMAAHLKEIPKPPIVLQPGIPDSLNQIILMALAKEPEKRFQSADAFRAALKSVDARALLGSSVTEYTIPPAGLPPASTVRRIAPASPASAAPPANAPNVLEPAHAAAAVAPNVAPPPSAAAGYRRGLYIALGAFLVVAVLAAAGFYLPRRAKTQADAEKPAAASPAPVSQPSTPSVSPAPTSQPESSPAEPVADPPKPQPPSPPVSDAEKLNHARQAQAQAEAETQARAAAAAALEEAENHHDQLNARASAVAQSLENLRNRQGAQGYGLRGDVVAAQQRMDSNLAKAQAALQSQDTAKARKYLEAAERDLEFLEKFLGR